MYLHVCIYTGIFLGDNHLNHLPPELGLNNNKYVLSQQVYSTVSYSPAPFIVLKILICACLIYFLEKSLVAIAMYIVQAQSRD